jgi:hypothetical protein
MKRRNFVKTTLLTGAATTMSAATFGLTSGFSFPSKPGLKAPFRLIYNNDTTNAAGVVSPFHEKGEPFREEMLVATIEEVAGRGVDAYMLSPGMGWVPWWQSKVEPDYFEWWKKRTGLEVKGARSGVGYEKYVYEGGDMVQVLIDTCRKLNMKPFVSLRLNDVHAQEDYINKNQRSLNSSRFYVEHPEWHLDPEHFKREGYYGKRGMDWAVPQVREEKLKLLRELAENYDLAGLELDFLRHSQLFRDNGPPAAERIHIITEFVADVRRALDKKPGKRRWLSVRIPLELSAHPPLGLDVRNLYQAGVDMFNLSGWYHTTQRTDIAKVRELAPGSAIYLEMTHSSAGHPYFIPRTKYGTTGDPRTSDYQFYTTANLAYKNGADGLSLFNFVYYRSGLGNDIPVMEPPFHILPKLTDRTFLAHQPQYNMLGKTFYHAQLPKGIKNGQSELFYMDVALPITHESGSKGTSLSFSSRLRIHTEKPLNAEHQLYASVNDTKLNSTNNTIRILGNPFDEMISPKGHRYAWDVPMELLKNGNNTIEIKVKSGSEINIIYIDLGIEN